MTNPQSPKKTIDGLLELLAEEVEHQSDAEVLAAALEDGGDVRAQASALKAYLLEKANTETTASAPLRAESPVAKQYRIGFRAPVLPTAVGETSLVPWTNKSVLRFSQGGDPLRKMTEVAETIVVKALEAGWEGPPYDPFQLAELLHIRVAPRSDIAEARTVKDPDDNFLIEFNPSLPSSRIKFSIAHEIAHTFFPDCLERARYRARRATYSDDDWQLEMLCNVGAAEILMPPGSFSSLREEGFDIVRLMQLRKELGVSTEALLLRVTKLAKTPIACFVASKRGAHLKADYAVFSPVWPAKRISLPAQSMANECSAIGSFTMGHELWHLGSSEVEVDLQVVGLPAYRGQEAFRVAGLMRPRTAKRVTFPSIRYLEGDVLEPIGSEPKVVAHIVNDATPRWGGKGVAAAMKVKWPHVQEEFKTWASANPKEFRLAGFHTAALVNDMWAASMVAQHGYGPSDRPRIRYAPLEACLVSLANFAARLNASIHMPKIGAGYGMGNWAVIEELIERLVSARGLQVYVYQLPQRKTARAQKTNHA